MSMYCIRLSAMLGKTMGTCCIRPSAMLGRDNEYILY